MQTGKLVVSIRPRYKRHTAVIGMLMLLLLVRCAEKKELQVQRYLDENMMDMPSTYTSADSAFLREHWTNGYYHYKAHCAECHGIFGDGQKGVPNFTQVQFDNYGASFIAGDKTNHAVMKNVTEEEFYSIFLFLQSLKRPEE